MFVTSSDGIVCLLYIYPFPLKQNIKDDIVMKEKYGFGDESSNSQFETQDSSLNASANVSPQVIPITNKSTTAKVRHKSLFR